MRISWFLVHAYTSFPRCVYASSEGCSPLLVIIGRETVVLLLVFGDSEALVVFLAAAVAAAAVPNRAARELGFKI